MALVVMGGLLTFYTDMPPPAAQKFVFAERHMGTQFQVTLFAADEATADRAKTVAFRVVSALDARLTDYKPDSELRQLSAKAGQGPVRISDELFDILRRAQEVSERSNGAFDVTVGPVVRLWRLARRTRTLPHEAELRAARQLVGFRMLHLDVAARTATLDRPGMKLDLGGIAKGYAADAMVRALRDAGCPQCLVAAGGDVAAGDAPPGADAWSVAIAPLVTSEKPRVIPLVRAAVSTSGDAEQFVEIAGKRYAHIVDPKTGLGLTDRFAVTVVAADSTSADALATAAAILGPVYGKPLIERWLAAARWVKLIDGRATIDETTAFPKFGRASR